MDKTNKKIMSLFFRNPEITQTELSKNFRISQPAISSRISEMKKKGLIKNIYGINFVRSNSLHLAKVEFSCTNTEKLFSFLKKCPYCINILTLSGSRNICLYVATEDIATIDSFIERHLRSNPFVDDLDFTLVISSAEDMILPVQIYTEKNKNNLCGKQCESCYHYKSNICLGCPASSAYKGEIL